MASAHWRASGWSNESPPSEGSGVGFQQLVTPLMVARTLLIATALVEMPVGVMLLASPPLVGELILGAPFDAPAAVIHL